MQNLFCLLHYCMASFVVAILPLNTDALKFFLFLLENKALTHGRIVVVANVKVVACPALNINII